MNSLRFETMPIPCASLSDSVLPSLYPLPNVQVGKLLDITEEDEVFWDIGTLPTLLPYSMQSLYGRDRQVTAMETAVLENDYLKATFMPGLGGKLWSLYDKVHERELLYVNDVIQPGNLALRNAWTSGGVEWNIGMIGHSPYTCSRIGTARLHTEKYGEVLRFYAFERIREVVYQMDFLLPEDSRVLLCRMRIKNTHACTIPMYWFSNMAVPQTPGCRVVVHADDAYHSGVGHVGKTTFPVGPQGQDWSRPQSSRTAADFFYKIPDKERKYIAYYDGDGRGMFQTSTARQKGRKLFVWGQNRGGASWQKWLTDKAGEYIEIQAGVNRTQYECIPMAPNVAWEWVEAYGPADLPADAVNGDYTAAVAATEAMIEQTVGEEWLEAFLKETKTAVALRPADEVIGVSEDGGWAALENARRVAAGEPVMEPHLTFSPMGEAQQPWRSLLETGCLSAWEGDGSSCLISATWEALLEDSLQRDPSNWYAWYQRGIMAFGRMAFSLAEESFSRSLALKDTPWSHYGLAIALFVQEKDACLSHMETALAALPHRIELGREYVKILLHFGCHARLVDTYATMTAALRADGYIRWGYGMALTAVGRLDEAQAVLVADGGLVIPDLRESENQAAELWRTIEAARAEREGRPFDSATARVPSQWDFSMTEVIE